MTIERLKDSDTEKVALMEKEIFSSASSAADIKKAAANDNNIYMTVKEDGDIIAYCAIWTSFDTADLLNIAVKEQYRKKHVAQKLLLQCMSECRSKGVATLLLEVRQSNLPAVCFYDKLGFQKIGIRKNYYANPSEDAIIMQKIL